MNDLSLNFWQTNSILYIFYIMIKPSACEGSFFVSFWWASSLEPECINHFPIFSANKLADDSCERKEPGSGFRRQFFIWIRGVWRNLHLSPSFALWSETPSIDPFKEFVFLGSDIGFDFAFDVNLVGIGATQHFFYSFDVGLFVD